MSFSKVKVTVPDVDRPFISGTYDYSNKSVKDANIKMMKSIKDKYFSSIQKYGKALDIPDGVIISFIASESGGIPVQVSNPSGAAKYDVWGIMAISPSAFYDAIAKWSSHVKTEEIPEVVKTKIQEKVPGLLKNLSVYPAEVIRNAFKNDQDFNIMAGCVVLRWLFERFNVLGVTLFNKAIVSYNAGLYQSFLVSEGSKTKPNLTPVDTVAMVSDKKVPLESRSYLLKVLGKDGFMDLYYKQNLVSPSTTKPNLPTTDLNAKTTTSSIVGDIVANISKSIF